MQRAYYQYYQEKKNERKTIKINTLPQLDGRTAGIVVVADFFLQLIE